MRSIRSWMRSRPTTAPRVLTWRMRAWAPSAALRSMACSMASTTIGSNRPLTCRTSTGPGAGSVAGAGAAVDRLAPARPRRRLATGPARRGRQQPRAGRSLVCAKVPPELVDPVPQLSAARVTIVAGKGGVGKTTVTAVLARAAAAAGKRVLAIELDGKPVLADLVGPDVTCEAISGSVGASRRTCRSTGSGASPAASTTSGVIDVVATAAPGIDDIVVLGTHQAARAQRRLGRHRRRRAGGRPRDHVPDLGRRSPRRRARRPGPRPRPRTSSSCSATPNAARSCW